MLNLLVITTQADASKRIPGMLSDHRCKVTIRPEVAATNSLVQQGLFDAIILAPSGSSEHTLDEIRALRRMNRQTPIAVVVKSAPLAWEESALSSGADLILREPIAAMHLERALDRFMPPEPVSLAPATLPSAQAIGAVSRGALEILRDFSHILGYSLDHKLFAEQFVRKIRDLVGVSKIAVFLEKPRVPHDHTNPGDRLSCATAIGISPEILDCFELSRSAGIGAHMVHSPQILQAASEHGRVLTAHDQKAQREFEILGCGVAVPISDRTRTIGVAMIGAHVTGRAFSSDELQLLFLLMEELGSAIKNTWLHKELAASHRLLADVLASLSSGCLVVNKDLQVLHANRAMIGFLKGDSHAGGRLEFADLPPKLAGPLYDTVVKGTKPEPFFFTGGAHVDKFLHVAVIPFQDTESRQTQSAMLVIEDFTQIEAAKRFEIESSKAKLIALIAKRFAHEIRNSLVPLATHEQLLDSEYENDDFRRSLKTALSRETGRIQRFTEQMLYLAQPARTPDQMVNMRDLVETCFDRVNGSSAPIGKLQLRSEAELPVVRCHRPALEHALQEILTNALQSANEDHTVTVVVDPGANGGVRLLIRDGGPGFLAETAAHATDPFYTTRNTGVGLGLTVAQKIINDHHGRLSIATRENDRDYDIEIWLPAAESL